MKSHCICKNQNRKITANGVEVIYEGPSGYTMLEICKFETGEFYIRALGDDEDRLEIFFCPVCGDKLK